MQSSFRQSRWQWLAQLLRLGPGKAKPKREKKPVPLGCFWNDGQTTVLARTKSEARAKLKALRGKLPPGLKVCRGSERRAA